MIEGKMEPADMMEHLSTIVEQFGIKFEYEVEHDTVVSLHISTTDYPDANMAIETSIIVVSMMAEMGLEMLSYFNKEEPLSIRLQQLRTLQIAINEVVQGRYDAAVDNSKLQIEVIKH